MGAKNSATHASTPNVCWMPAAACCCNPISRASKSTARLRSSISTAVTGSWARARPTLADELRVAESALAAIPYATPLLYARVDLIRDGADAPCVLELELTEPSLFFVHGAGAAERFVAAIAAHAAG